uniref:Uncharacterized protein n=1 Tax=Pseudo-nitzschia arenysensis TaxID=697910 RepID=A0A7R9ZTH2_9STRA
MKYYLEGSSSNESRPIHGLTLEQKTKLWNESSIGDGIVQERITDIREDLEDIIEDLRKDKIDKMNLCISGTKMEGGSIDRLRSMYGSYQIRKGGGLKTRTNQFVASARLCRVLRSRITLDTIQQSLMIAKNSQPGASYGWQFDYFGHKIFYELSKGVDLNRNENNNNPFRIKVDPFDVVQGKVSQLNQSSLYWAPDKSNFSGIDAAIAIDKVLYCLQCTINSKEHTFNYSTFLSKVWDQLADGFKLEIDTIFVLPKESEAAQTTSYKANLVKGKTSY